jgi:phage tail-like protein
MPDLLRSFVFALESSLGGVEVGTFRKCSGVESETEIIEYKEATKDGKILIRKVPGSMKWGDITLERRIDSSRALWEWRKQVLDGDIDTARRHGSIVIKDSQMTEVARWNFENGWVSKWTGADLDAGSNEIATEKVVICHEGVVRALACTPSTRPHCPRGMSTATETCTAPGVVLLHAGVAQRRDLAPEPHHGLIFARRQRTGQRNLGFERGR